MIRTILSVLLWAALAAPAAAERGTLAKVSLQLVAEGFNSPLLLVSPPDGSDRRFLGEQSGIVHVLDRSGTPLDAPFIDLRKKMAPLLPAFDERGLLAMAFHPNFSENGRLFINYSAKRRSGSPFTGKTAYTWRTSEFRISAENPNQVAPASERVLLELDWVNRKHNGGGLAFGPDGYLYLGVGDGGGAHGVPDVFVPPKISDQEKKDKFRHAAEIKEDPFKIPLEFHKYDKYAQDTLRLKGKILRLDVDSPPEAGKAYAIPPTNIFRGKDEGLDEIYAWGFRNPFRISFDRAGNGDIFVSGVAESFWETVYMVDRQGNYGWSVREGRHCYERARAFNPPKDCARFGPLGERIMDPVIEYPNWSVKRPWAAVEAEPLGTANVGGFIYRGKAIPELYGKFVFGDFSSIVQKPSGQVFVATPSAAWRSLWPIKKLAELDVRLHSLGEDADGELYLMTTAQGIPVGNTGKLWKLVPAE